MGLLYVQEVHQHAGVVQPIALNRHLHLEIVAVYVLARALVIAQGVAGRKSLFYGKCDCFW
jgi:hypothetical protein